MKKLLATVAALATMSTMAFAERYVMITHTQGTDPFWPVVEKGGRDAAAAIGADFEYNFDPSGDMSGMAKLIEAAAATNPDGIIVSLPDPDCIGWSNPRSCRRWHSSNNNEFRPREFS